MENLKTGLILGKFAPFHKGHQYLLECAKNRVDKLYVLIYDAKRTTHIPLKTRADWIRIIYPDVVVIEGRNAPEDTGYTPEIMKMQEDYILSMMPEKITHFFSSEPYGEHVSKALGAQNVVIDKDRNIVKVSATAVRTGRVLADLYLHPVVNRDVTVKVLVLGAESTGKSTLVEAAAKKYDTNYVQEIGRDYWFVHHDHNGKLTPYQLLTLARLHRSEEIRTFEVANRVTFVDTGASTTRQYCLDYGYKVPAELDKMVQEEKKRYDAIVLCNPTIPYCEDGTRRGEKTRMETHNKIVADLALRGVPYYNILETTLDQRLKRLSEIVSEKLNR